MWYIYNEILSHRKEQNLAIYNDMAGPGGYYAKWNKKENGEYHMISFICYVQFEKINKTERNLQI